MVIQDIWGSTQLELDERKDILEPAGRPDVEELSGPPSDHLVSVMCTGTPALLRHDSAGAELPIGPADVSLLRLVIFNVYGATLRVTRPALHEAVASPRSGAEPDRLLGKGSVTRRMTTIAPCSNVMSHAPSAPGHSASSAIELVFASLHMRRLPAEAPKLGLIRTASGQTEMTRTHPDSRTCPCRRGPRRRSISHPASGGGVAGKHRATSLNRRRRPFAAPLSPVRPGPRECVAS